MRGGAASRLQGNTRKRDRRREQVMEWTRLLDSWRTPELKKSLLGGSPGDSERMPCRCEWVMHAVMGTFFQDDDKGERALGEPVTRAWL